jgi:hypothetical protein
VREIEARLDLEILSPSFSTASLACTKKQMRSTIPFVAFERSRKQLPIIAVDIGYSAKARSCGIAWSGREAPICPNFGNAVRKVAELCVESKQPVLVVEAALSTFHRPNGNPDLRGSFEVGRGWYWGPGAVSVIAASRFLQMLAGLLPDGKQVFLAEAFLSNKSERTKHTADAGRIVEEFWKCEPQLVENAVEPFSDLIVGVPSVRVFGVRSLVLANKRLEPTRSKQRAAQA